MISLALCSANSGVGTTTLVYHLSHMISRLGVRVMVADLDPQATLTSAFLDDDDIAVLWRQSQVMVDTRVDSRLFDMSSDVGTNYGTIAQAVHPVMADVGDAVPIDPIGIDDALWLLPGDLDFGTFESQFSEAWRQAVVGDGSDAARKTAAVHGVLSAAADKVDADVVLMDVGPNLCPTTRVSLLTADAVVMPLKADVFSLRSLGNLGSILGNWRSVWRETILPQWHDDRRLPQRVIRPLGYIVMQPEMRIDRPLGLYHRCLARVPDVFRSAALESDDDEIGVRSQQYEIAVMRNYRTLLLMALEARKPMFDLQVADGAIGSLQTLVRRCYTDFHRVAEDMVALLGRLR